MIPSVVHRRARGRYSLCQKVVSDVNQLALDEDLVTCEECKKILSELAYTESKTALLEKLKLGEEDEPDKKET